MLAAGAAAIGFAAAHIVRRNANHARRFDDRTEPRVPVLNVGRARTYDPDCASGHPTHDILESRRDLTAHA